MTYCHVSNQIAIHADEPDNRTVNEILSELLKNGKAWISGQEIEFYEITSSISEEDKDEAIEGTMQGDTLAVYNLYIKALEEFINDK